jgi:hypothetical protein
MQSLIVNARGPNWGTPLTPQSCFATPIQGSVSPYCTDDRAPPVGIDFAELTARARGQREGLETYRLAAALEAQGGSPAAPA